MDYARLSATERRFLPPAVAVSTVAFALRPPADARVGDGERADADASVTLWIPLVRRTRAPFSSCWALPGGPIPWDETLVDTSLRTLRDAVRRDPGYLEQLYAFGEVERSADAQRLVTIAYWALYGEGELGADAAARGEAHARTHGGSRGTRDAEPRRGDSTETTRRWDEPRFAISRAPAAHGSGTEMSDANVAWFSADRLPPLAFDHADIVSYALWRLRRKTEYSTVAYRFLGRTFTLAQLRRVHEAVLGHGVDPANFRRQALAQGVLVDTGETETGAPHRPARLYRFRDEAEPRSLP